MMADASELLGKIVSLSIVGKTPPKTADKKEDACVKLFDIANASLLEKTSANCVHFIDKYGFFTKIQIHDYADPIENEVLITEVLTNADPPVSDYMSTFSGIDIDKLERHFSYLLGQGNFRTP